MSLFKYTLCLDFDGVIHSYTSGWQGPNIIPDAPVPGAFEFIQEALQHFNVAIFSSRSGYEHGRDAMRKWFVHHSGDAPWICDLTFPTAKPPAWVSIDDRAITFTGEWPSIETLRAFRPWNAKKD